MKKISLGVVACALATVMSAVSIPSYAAMPLPSPTVSRSTDVENVRDIRRFHGRHYSWRGDRGGYHTWRGHRGYRDYRPGYRRHSDGFWYPLAVFGAAAIIGNAVANQPRSHASWCAERYRSYRASDNTYQPTNGPRRQCR